MWATFLGLMMQRLAAQLGTVTGLHLAEGLNTVLIYVQAAVGVDVGNRPGPDDATVGGPAGHSHRPSSSRGLLQASQHKVNKKLVFIIKILNLKQSTVSGFSIFCLNGDPDPALLSLTFLSFLFSLF